MKSHYSWQVRFLPEQTCKLVQKTQQEHSRFGWVCQLSPAYQTNKKTLGMLQICIYIMQSCPIILDIYYTHIINTYLHSQQSCVCILKIMPVSAPTLLIHVLKELQKELLYRWGCRKVMKCIWDCILTFLMW